MSASWHLPRLSEPTCKAQVRLVALHACTPYQSSHTAHVLHASLFAYQADAPRLYVPWVLPSQTRFVEAQMIFCQMVTSMTLLMLDLLQAMLWS